VTLFHPSSTFGGVWCGFERDTLTWVSSHSNNNTEAEIQQQTLPPEASPRFVRTLSGSQIRSTLPGKVLNALSAKRRYATRTNWKQTINNITRYRWMNESLLPNGILPPASWDYPEPSRFDYSRCSWMAIIKLSINDLLIDNVPGAPPPEDTPNEQPIDPQQPDLTCSPDPPKTKAHRQVVGVKNAWGKAYGIATGLYNKHRKYSEQWNPWHPFRSAHNFEQAQSFSQQTKTWIDHLLRCGLDNFNIKSFQSANALQKILSELNFGLRNDSWIEDESHIFGTLYSRDNTKCILFVLAHLPFRAHLNFEWVGLAGSEGRRIYSEMNIGDWWWDTHDQLLTGTTIVPVTFASDKTLMTNFVGDQHAWPLYHTIGNIRKEICRTPKKHA